MREMRGIDLKRARLVPSSVFGSPEEVVGSQQLSLAQKLTILRRWEFDARRVAGLGSNPSLLPQVQSALKGLCAEAGPSPRARWQSVEGGLPAAPASDSYEVSLEAGVAAHRRFGGSRSL